MAAVAGVTALVGAVKGLISIGSNMMNITSQFEQTQKSLETVLQSAEKGQKLFEDLRKFSFDTTFGVDELASASSQLLNAGESLGRLQTDLKMLGDLAQGDKTRFAELASIFSKVQTTGKVTGMQLQQIALRGIPIQKTLKEMGVTGVASAEQLTEAFQKLTQEGGQFHNAMGNIIDTIEGKKGFITDTLKEVNVNFAELTGLTAAYKSSLDTLYSALDWINNKLIDWKENPVMSAIISGALTVAITGIVSIIGIGLVSAIAKLNASLAITATLKTVLTSPAGWIALAVTGVVALGVGVANLIKSHQKIAEEAKKTTDEMERQKNIANEFYSNPEANSANAQLEQLNKDLAIYLKSKESVQEKLNASNKQMEDLNKDVAKYGLTEFYDPMTATYISVEKRKEQIQADIDKWTKQVEIANNVVKFTENSINRVQERVNELNKVNAFKETFAEAYEEIHKADNELSQLENKLNEMELYKSMIGLYDADGKKIEGDKKQIDEVIKYLQDKINTVKLNLKIENQKEWQEALQKAFGFDNETQSKLLDKWAKGGNGGDWVDAFVQAKKETYDRISRTNSRLGINQNDTGAASSYAKMQIESLMKVYNELMQDPAKFGVDDSNFGLLDNTVAKIQTHLDSFIELYKAQGGDMEELDEVLNNTTKAVGDLGDETNKTVLTLKQTIEDNFKQAIGGTDVGNFLDKYAKSQDALSALIEVFIQDLTEYVVGNEKMQYLLNIIRNILQALSPFLDAILNVVAVLAIVLKPILDALKWALNWIFGDFNKACDQLYNSMERESIERDKNTQSLISQYQRLLSTMKEQEEYYIHKKAELNAFALENKVSGITPVNDMILTPHGTFSTNPNDTIIATKNPSGLGRSDIKVTVNNYSDSNVDVQQRKDANGMTEMLVTISKKIASDVAGGYNGWDGALAMQKQRVDGRRI